MKIINFPDFNETAKNRYYDELLNYFDKDDVDSVKYSLKDNPAELLLKYAARRGSHYDLILGCGFGAVLAIAFSRLKDDKIKTILINPMYPLSKYKDEEMPDYPYGGMLVKATEQDICWEKKIVRNMHLILGRDDDITDTMRTADYFYKENVHYVDGGHFPQGDDFSRTFANLLGVAYRSPAEKNCLEDGTKQDITEPDENKNLVIDIMAIESDSGDEDWDEENEDEDEEYNDDDDDKKDKYADLEIDCIHSENGNFTIQYHTSAYGDDILYLYFKDGKWIADSKNGICISSENLTAVLEKAIPSFAASVDLKERMGDGGWLLVW